MNSRGRSNREQPAGVSGIKLFSEGLMFFFLFLFFLLGVKIYILNIVAQTIQKATKH